MIYYYKKQTNQAIIYYNHNDGSLQVDTIIKDAINALHFQQKDDLKDLISSITKLLIILHGGIDSVTSFAWKKPAVCLRFSSAGSKKTFPKIVNNRFPNVDDIEYWIRGKAGSELIPKEKDVWKKLIAWLISININDIVKNNSSAPPLPDDNDLKRYIFHELIPECILAYYIYLIAQKNGVSCSLDESTIKEAQIIFKDMCSYKLDRDERDYENIDLLRDTLATVLKESISS